MKSITRCAKQLFDYLRRVNLSTYAGIVVLLGISAYVGCADTGFDPQPSTCLGGDEDVNSQKLENKNCRYSVSVSSAGQVDVLFVIDNSGSMSTEHRKMAQAFGGFINTLAGLDYQIAMITTDVSLLALQNDEMGRKGAPEVRYEASTNGAGSFRDGRFLPFDANARTFILSADTGTDAERAAHQRLFEQTVQRPETLACDRALQRAVEDDSFDYEPLCPSTDERAIYAANLAMQRNERTRSGKYLFRETSHLAIVIVSDEDERSRGGTTEQPLSDLDQPVTLAANFKKVHKNTAASSVKTLSVHAVIVKPGDAACLRKQSVQIERGSHQAQEGRVYQQLVDLTDDDFDHSELERLTGNRHFIGLTGGHSGSICASNYTQELGSIASHIQVQSKNIHLNCEEIVEGSLRVKIVHHNGNEVAATEDQYTLQPSNLRIQNLPTTAREVKVTYDCMGF